MRQEVALWCHVKQVISIHSLQRGGKKQKSTVSVQAMVLRSNIIRHKHFIINREAKNSGKGGDKQHWASLSVCSWSICQWILQNPSSSENSHLLRAFYSHFFANHSVLVVVAFMQASACKLYNHLEFKILQIPCTELQFATRRGMLGILAPWDG